MPWSRRLDSEAPVDQQQQSSRSFSEHVGCLGFQHALCAGPASLVARQGRNVRCRLLRVGRTTGFYLDRMRAAVCARTRPCSRIYKSIVEADCTIHSQANWLFLFVNCTCSDTEVPNLRLFFSKPDLGEVW